MLVNTKIFKNKAFISSIAHGTMYYCNHVIFVTVEGNLSSEQNQAQGH